MLLIRQAFTYFFGFRSRGSANEQKKLEKLEVANQKMGVSKKKSSDNNQKESQRC